MNRIKKQWLLHIGEGILLILTLLFVAAVYTSADRISPASCSDVAAAVLGPEAAAPRGSAPGTGVQFQKTFGVDASELAGLVYFRPASGMDATELIIAKSESPKVRQQLLAAVREHLSQRQALFEGYAPAQYALLGRARAVEKNGFVFCAVGEDADRWYDSFYQAVRT